MNRDDVIRMAREAKFPVNHPDWADAAVRFAALVTADARAARIAAQTENEALKERMNRADAERCAAVLAEREACAKVCQNEWSTIDELAVGKVFAAAIRARGAA